MVSGNNQTTDEHRIKKVNCSFFLINHQFIHSAVRLPDSHKSESVWINQPGYSFQREWERWNKWRRTFPRGHPPVIQSHGTWLRSSPPLLGSAVETQAGCWVKFSGTIKDREEKHYGVDLYLEDGENCRREGVKVGCWRFVFEIKPVGKQQTKCDQASETQKVTFTPPTTGGWSSILPPPLGCCTLL